MAVKKIGTLNKHENPATNENEFDIENYMNANWDKIKEVVDNNAGELTSTQEKATTLQENVEEIEGNITELQAEQTAQNKKIEELDDNQIHITTEKSNNLNIQDASGQNAKIKIFGISEQETRSGINLTNYKEWVGLSTKEQITKKDDDEIICTITDSSYGVRDIERILKPNTNYTACVDFEFNGTFGNQYGLRVNVNGSITSLKADGLVNFTTDETGKAEMRYYVGFPYSGENATLTVSNIRLYEGTYTKENIPDYEDYGASPSPKYPSEIQNVEGNLDITVCNKNLWNDDSWNIRDVIDGKNVLKFSGYYVSGTGVKIGNPLTFTNKFKKGTTYTVSGKFKKTTYDNQLCVMYTDFSIQYGGKFTDNFEKSSVSITTSSEKEVLYFAIFSGSSSSNSYVEEGSLQLEENNVATENIQNEQQTITFPLAENQKMMKDSETKDDGIHHKRKQIELDGTENWIALGINYYLTINDKKTRYELIKGKMLCTHFKETTTGVTGGVEAGEFFEGYYSTGNRNVFFNYDNGEGGVEGFKSYLSQQKQAGTPVILEYELEEEEIEPYTEEQQEADNQLQNAKTYKTVTNVFTDNAEVEMNYIADTKTYVDNEINSIKNQLNTINELLSTTTTSAMLLDNMQSDLESEVL